MALDVWEYQFSVTGGGSKTFSNNTRTQDEEQRLSGNGLMLAAWLHDYASETLLEAAIQEIRDLSTDFTRLVRRSYPGMKGMTAVSLDGSENIGTLSKRGGGGTWNYCIMSAPRVSEHYPLLNSKVGCKVMVTFLQLAP